MQPAEPRSFFHHAALYIFINIAKTDRFRVQVVELSHMSAGVLIHEVCIRM